MLRNLALVALLAVLICGANVAFANNETNDPELGYSNYVVIGAFEFVNNAEKFTAFANEKKALPARMAVNPKRNLYYVYILRSDDLQPALDLAQKIRDEHEDLWDTWTYTGSLGPISENAVTVEQINTVADGMENESEEVVETIEVAEDVTAEVTEEVEEIIEEEVTEEEEIEEEVIEEEVVTLEPKEGYHYLYFNTVKKDSYKEVKGRIQLIDPVRAKELTTAQSHEIVEVKNPDNGQDLIKASTKIFGFKEVQHLVNLSDPLNDSTEAYVDVVGDSVILNFELERFKKGDVLIMYNVYFYKDASIMKPESKYELISLLDMLQENEKLEVRIHGHTNSNARGKIIFLDHENPDFFNMKSAKKEAIGSAKELSLERAKTIEAWLVQQGVSDDRMTVKGWGGKKMIYDKHDTQAHKNVRVEIEIVEE